MVFVQLSDPHLLGSAQDRLYGLDTDARLRQALEHLCEHYPEAEFVTISGDLSGDGCYESYQRLSRMLADLPMPSYPIIGNHDDRRAFARWFPDLVDERGFVQYVREFGERVFCFLDTVVEGEEYGELCEYRLEWLGRQLERYRDRELCLVMHHHPIPSGLLRMDRIAPFRSYGAFWDLLGEYGNVRAIFHGHLHLTVSGMHRGVWIHSAPSTSFSLLYHPDRREEYFTPDLPGAYSVITYTPWGWRVNRQEFEGVRLYRESVEGEGESPYK